MRSTARPDDVGCLELIGRSAAAVALRERVRQAGGTRSHVLLHAPRGVDASGVARAIHALQSPARAAFLAVPCGATEAGTLEDLLFGVAPPAGRSARNGLERLHPGGRVLAARGGTLFLEDVDELPARVQRRLGQLLRDHEVEIATVGPRRLDLRVIASSELPMEAEVQEGRFRADLHRRLTAIRISLPSLRERLDDLGELVPAVMSQLCAAAGEPARSFTPAALMVLTALPWRGNTTELREALARLLRLVSGGIIRQEDVLGCFHLGPGLRMPPGQSLREARAGFEREYIAAVLERHRWRMSEAARALGIERANLYRKTRKLGIQRPVRAKQA
jgi:DNA-binding NtrC family response regulator